MTAETIMREALADGVILALSPTGTIKATGDRAVLDRWLSLIRDQKAEIVEALKMSVAEPQNDPVIVEISSPGDPQVAPPDDVPDQYGHWSESEVLLCMERTRQFVRRGVPELIADELACRLVERDRQEDTRRTCAECRAFRNGGCIQGKRPVCGGGVEVLHQCQGFIDPGVIRYETNGDQKY